MVQRNYRFDPGMYNSHWLMLQEIPEGSRVLEIGTASGYMGEYLIEKKNCEIWGIEPAEELYNDAKQYGYTKLFKISAENLLTLPEMANEKFDVILLGDVLEHMKNPDEVLAGLKNFLKPTRRCVISLPNIAHYSIRWHLLIGRFDMQDGGILDRTHLHFFTLKTMCEMVEKSGLKIKKARPAGGAWERFGINKLFGIGRKVLFMWPTLLSQQFLIIATLE